MNRAWYPATNCVRAAFNSFGSLGCHDRGWVEAVAVVRVVQVDCVPGENRVDVACCHGFADHPASLAGQDHGIEKVLALGDKERGKGASADDAGRQGETVLPGLGEGCSVHRVSPEESM